VDEPTHPPLPDENGVEDRRAARRRWELAKIARAEAEIDAGYGITGPELEKFLHDLLHSDQPVTVPPARRLPRRT